MSEWQPISTAPMDELVIVACRLGHVMCGFWIPSDIDEGPDWYEQGARKMHPNIYPTHWMPLPPPKDKE